MGLHVILVDDDDLMLRMLEPHLEELDVHPRVARVLTATSPEAALAHIEAAPEGPLAVVSDFNLKASRNGLDVLRHAAARRPESVRVLISGYSEDQIGDVTAGGLVHGFVEKPLRLRELVEPIQRIVQERLRAARVAG